ncbi:ATP synthase F1 subcomplex epsilon subunit [Cohaesibacter sp. ES.047]|uniref:F0F1 ATP synthase subunit epsilon n=1 Tax=Cohaesibacter sp. ES.047 TaxID=1798205 RepID=UPI000BB7AEBB|nr:F0F1 ATP synthase subunit epsilon [Cohaesibacter sp. ES.047]SNY90676.1 ATP synthase F1 subcomplex epsilon subunit [Cohaesibacter sp. ES.047]
MAEAFSFELVSPERLVLSAACRSVVVPGMDGFFTVLKDHAPVIASVSPGVLEAELEDGSKQDIYIRGGFADVTPSSLKVLVEQALPVVELDLERVQQLIKDAEEDVADAETDEVLNEAALRLARLEKLRLATTK